MRFLPLLLVIMMTGCDSCYTADRADVPVVNPATPPVTSLAVVPPKIYVTPGAKFVVYARMLDKDNGVLPEHSQLQFTTGAGLTIQGHAKDSAQVEALATTTGTTTSVTAQIGTMSATASIIVLTPSAGGTLDTVWSDDALWRAPDAALINDTLASPPVYDSLVGFVKLGLLGDLVGGTGEVARLSTHQAFRLAPTTWQTGSVVVNLSSVSNPSVNLSWVTSPSIANLPRQLAFRVWIAITDPTATSIAQADAEYALHTLVRQWTGLVPQPSIVNASGAGDFTLDLGPAPKLECKKLQQGLHDLGIPVDAPAFAPESLNVVYVYDILDPPQGPGPQLPAGLAGYTCPTDASLGSVIFISHLRGSGTLTHELGHAIGLHEPDFGHTVYQPGFSYTNMMWPYEWDATTAPRSTFSLGQAFRMNADDHSWAHLTGVSRDCDSLPNGGRSCPRLERDWVKLP